MTSETKTVVLAALSNHMGDNLARARMAFDRLPDAQLDEEYGQSGKTRRQILAEYEAHEKAVHAAIVEVQQL